MREVLLLFVCYRWENWSLERLSYLLKLHHLVRGEEIYEISWVQSLNSQVPNPHGLGGWECVYSPVYLPKEQGPCLVRCWILSAEWEQAPQQYLLSYVRYDCLHHRVLFFPPIQALCGCFTTLFRSTSSNQLGWHLSLSPLRHHLHAWLMLRLKAVYARLTLKAEEAVTVISGPAHDSREVPHLLRVSIYSTEKKPVRFQGPHPIRASSRCGVSKGFRS